MINLKQINIDFNKIANDIKSNTGALEPTNFVCRLVICYKDTDKNKNLDNYNYIMEYVNKLNSLNIPYKIKDNKYVYLLHKKLFTEQTEFDKMQTMFATTDKNNNIKILTINNTNLDNNKKQILDFCYAELVKEYKK